MPKHQELKRKREFFRADFFALYSLSLGCHGFFPSPSFLVQQLGSELIPGVVKAEAVLRQNASAHLPKRQGRSVKAEGLGILVLPMFLKSFRKTSPAFKVSSLILTSWKVFCCFVYQVKQANQLQMDSAL